MRTREQVTKGEALVRRLVHVFPYRIGAVTKGAIGSPWFRVTKSAGGETMARLDSKYAAGLEKAKTIIDRLVLVAKAGADLTTEAQAVVSQDMIALQSLLGGAAPAVREKLTGVNQRLGQAIEATNDLNVSNVLEQVQVEVQAMEQLLNQPQQAQITLELPGQTPVAAPVAAPAPTIIPTIPTPAAPAVQPVATAPVIATPSAPVALAPVAPAPTASPAPAAAPAPGVAVASDTPVTKGELQALFSGFATEMRQLGQELTQVAKSVAGGALPAPVQAQASTPMPAAAPADDCWGFEDLSAEISRGLA